MFPIGLLLALSFPILPWLVVRRMLRRHRAAPRWVKIAAALLYIVGSLSACLYVLMLYLTLVFTDGSKPLEGWSLLKSLLINSLYTIAPFGAGRLLLGKFGRRPENPPEAFPEVAATGPRPEDEVRSGILGGWFGHHWRKIAWANLALFAFNFFLWFSPYSLAGTYPDLMFPLVVGCAALVSLALFANIPDPVDRKQGRKRLRPSLIFAAVYGIGWIALFVPPFTLGAMFMLAEIADERIIQQEAAPDGSRTAYVHWRDVGSYAPGNGRVSVKVRHRSLPLFEREVYSNSRSYLDPEAGGYVRWNKDGTLDLSGVAADGR